MPNTLDYVGDGDDISAVQSIEETFDIAFSNEELENVNNVGDFYDLILRKVSREGAAGKCASAMSFYRLRRALSDLRPDLKITPSTKLIEFPARSPKFFFKELEQKTGLRIGSPALSWIGNLGAFLAVFPFLAFLPALAWNEWVQPLHVGGKHFMGIFVLGVILMWIDPRRLHGDLRYHAEEAARRNYGKLIKLGANGSDAQIWKLLAEALAAECRLLPEEITRETVFFRSQLNAP